jgi:hypothetical protein
MVVYVRRPVSVLPPASMEVPGIRLAFAWELPNAKRMPDGPNFLDIDQRTDGDRYFTFLISTLPLAPGILSGWEGTPWDCS